MNGRILIAGLLALLGACDLIDGGLSETSTELAMCDTAAIDDVDISNVSIDGDILSLEASYGGGCEDHFFQLCWDGEVMESDPPQISVHLIHDGNDDSCEAYLSEELSFDLSPAGFGSGETVIVGVAGSGESAEYVVP